ncbi:MAG: hypothetical protein JJU08_06395 [Rhodobacteraceae bacterium]|nr:hypothetical protein [Paracoccaceae bacterium]
MNTNVTLEFLGDLPEASFAEFAAHRAARLSLSHRMIEQDSGRALVQLSGPEALVDAFEMALSLGPHTCIVRDVRRQENCCKPPGGDDAANLE